jgi:IS5 family transposase
MRSTTASRCGVSRGLSWADKVVPDESTILRLRHLLEQHGLTHAIFDAVAELLEEQRLLLRSGTIVRDHHRGAEFDQERHCDSRPRDEADPQGSQLALRDEVAGRALAGRVRGPGRAANTPFG